MNEEIEEKIIELASRDKLSEAIAVIEQQIMQNSVSDFVEAIDKNLIHLTNAVVNFLDQFSAEANKGIDVQSIYAEINDFTINYDLWYVSLFAFDRNGRLDDTDWLADYNYASASNLQITGLENIQAIYKDYMDTEKWEDEANENAAQECAALIVLRVQELFKAVKEAGRAKNSEWAALPIYVAAHDSYFNLLYQA